MTEEYKGIWCLNCGMASFSKSGKTPDGRQRIKCKYCKTKTTVGALRRGERLFKEEDLLPILRKNPLTLSSAELYAMGVLIADGCFTQGHTLSYSCSSKDKDLIENVKRILEIPSEVKTYRQGKELQVRWRYKYSKDFWAQLGMVERKTGKEKWLPYMDSHHFIRGFLDGDGCIYTNLSNPNSLVLRVSFTGDSRDFLEALNNHIHTYTGIGLKKLYQVKKDSTALGLRYRKKDSLILCRYLYQDSEGLRLERKYKKYLEI